MFTNAGEDVLNWLSFGHTSIRKTLGSEARILAFYYWMTYCILKAGKPKFQPVEPPPPATAEGESAEGGKGQSDALTAAAASNAH